MTRVSSNMRVNKLAGWKLARNAQHVANADNVLLNILVVGHVKGPSRPICTRCHLIYRVNYILDYEAWSGSTFISCSFKSDILILCSICC